MIFSEILYIGVECIHHYTGSTRWFWHSLLCCSDHQKFVPSLAPALIICTLQIDKLIVR